ncbi:VOC family protein [Microbacterium sp. ARD31]|uniref:VOC family protein n=1 Tax=Microbacterium sp. ARD31 TaxID=2962576 RepID=UPI002882B8CE|nr:VOC family protein [Microbacterium sp. ARD31]MDT0186582.1 VOC family protein [Microbacterium sp. ARD31]
MTVDVTPHLNFRGRAREALTFYRDALGGELVLVTYADAHAVQDPAEADQVMWGQVVAPSGVRVMAYDVPAATAYDAGTIPFFVSLRGDDADEVSALWSGLADGATVLQDLGPSGWAPLYGMLRDRFGVTWVLDVAVAYPA